MDVAEKNTQKLSQPVSATVKTFQDGWGWNEMREVLALRVQPGLFRKYTCSICDNSMAKESVCGRQNLSGKARGEEPGRFRYSKGSDFPIPCLLPWMSFVFKDLAEVILVVALSLGRVCRWTARWRGIICVHVLVPVTCCSCRTWPRCRWCPTHTQLTSQLRSGNISLYLHRLFEILICHTNMLSGPYVYLHRCSCLKLVHL